MSKFVFDCLCDGYGGFRPTVMGILNVTPDSFYATSRCQSDEIIVNRVRQIIAEGGTIVDVGGCSTRPGCELVSEEEELRRLLPALALIRSEFPDVPLSVDTFRASVAERVVGDYGVDIINDVTGGMGDSRMFKTIGRLGVLYVLTHSVEQDCENWMCMQDIFIFFARKLRQLIEFGTAQVIIDPGFGFAKDLKKNYHVLYYLSELTEFRMPILVGLSRKRMIWEALEISPEEALNGTSVLNLFALQQGASILRVHDVKEAVQTIKLRDLYLKGQTT